MAICPSCEADVDTSDLRYEHEPMTRSDPGYEINGCVRCLGTGRHVKQYQTDEEPDYDAIRDLREADGENW